MMWNVLKKIESVGADYYFFDNNIVFKRNNEVLYLDYDFNEISLISSSGRINIIGAFGELFLVGTPKEIIEYKKEFNNSIIFWLFEMFRRTSRIKYKHGFVIR